VHLSCSVRKQLLRDCYTGLWVPFALQVLVVEKPPAMNLDIIMDIKSKVETLTEVVAGVCVFLLKCRTLLSGEHRKVRIARPNVS